jgi:serine/threonine-protein kinase
MEAAEQFALAIKDTYTIARELPGGGTARVFVATDKRLGRRVVIKTLPPELSGTISNERFAGEIQLLARLQHPHIVPLLTAGEAGGYSYFVMPFVQGESLRQRLLTQARLAPDEAVRLAMEIADALGYAHGEGVVHRDIKPENILLSGEHAMLADFGIARALDIARTQAGQRLTLTGMVVGTPAYLSPEQAAGEDVDGRCDIYSLGAVLYEMLSGRPPFTAATPAALIGKRFTEFPPSLSGIIPTVSAGLERAVEQAMAREPGDRFQNAGELVLALRSAVRSHDTPGASADKEQSIAVLPFANVSADPDTDYFSDGVTDEIINALVHVPGLRVAARTSSYAFKGTAADIHRIGVALGVRSVLEGSVRRAGTRVRVTAQLVDVTTGYQLWSERYDCNLADVFAIQDEIAVAVAAQLEMKLVRKAIPTSTHFEAYDLYLRGRSFWLKRGADLETARTFFERAVAADPHLAAAYAGLADCDSILVAYGAVAPDEVRERARGHASKALALDPSLADAHYSMGLVEGWINARFGEADACLRRASELNHTAGLAIAYRAFFATIAGQRAATIPLARRAADTEPMSALVHALASMGLSFAREYETAHAVAERALEIDDRLNLAHLAMGWAHQGRGNESDAEAHYRAALTGGLYTTAVISLALLLVRLDRTEEAHALVGGRGRVDGGAAFDWVVGDEQAALAKFEHALIEANAWPFITALLPGMTSLLRHPRFLDLLRRGGREDLSRVYVGLAAAEGPES